MDSSVVTGEEGGLWGLNSNGKCNKIFFKKRYRNRNKLYCIETNRVGAGHTASPTPLVWPLMPHSESVYTY